MADYPSFRYHRLKRIGENEWLMALLPGVAMLGLPRHSVRESLLEEDNPTTRASAIRFRVTEEETLCEGALVKACLKARADKPEFGSIDQETFTGLLKVEGTRDTATESMAFRLFKRFNEELVGSQ